MHRPTVHLVTLGCRLNEAESERWARELAERGWWPCEEPEQADLLVVNTCAVTAEAARKSRQLLRRAHRRNPRAKLVVSGCHATLEPTSVAAIEGVDLLVPNGDKDRLPELVDRHIEPAAMPAAAAAPAVVAMPRARTRAFVKVQDGCRWRCTFCIVTVARGAERSRPVGEVVAEVNHLVAAGVREVVLSGVHLGGYGSDLDSDLVALLRAVLADTDVPRIRLGSLEPWDLPEALFALFEDARLQPHLHLPLQSGSDTILRRMGRRCRSAQFRALVAALRSAVPGINITTDVIVGFPGEGEREWRETVSLIEALELGRLHVFPYSPRPGTAAARMPGQVPHALRRERCRVLHGLSERGHRRQLQQAVGQVVPVLWESSGHDPQGQPVLTGYTPSYLRVRIPAGTVEVGSIGRTRLVGVCPHGALELVGEPVCITAPKRL